MMFFKICFKSVFTYRSEALTKIISSILIIILNLLLWIYLYSRDISMIDYMIKYTVLSSLIGMFYLKNVGLTIGKKIRDGSFVIDLLRPVNSIYLIWQKEFANLISNIIIQGIPICLFFLPVLMKLPIDINIILGIVSVIFGHILFFLIYLLLGLLAVVFINIEFYNRILNDTIKLLAGSFIPLSLFPETLKFINDFLPFRFLYSFPIELFINGEGELLNFLILFVWIAVFLIGDYYCYKKVMKKLIVMGG